MKLLSLLFILISLNSSSFSQKSDVQNADTLKVLFNTYMNKWKDAYNSGNAENLKPLYSEDAIYISSHVKGLTAEGRKQIIEYFQNGINMGGHINKIEILSLDNSCGLASLLCGYEANNNGEIALGRNLIVLKKINSTWLIIKHMTVV